MYKDKQQTKYQLQLVFYYYELLCNCNVLLYSSMAWQGQKIGARTPQAAPVKSQSAPSDPPQQSPSASP